MEPFSIALGVISLCTVTLTFVISTVGTIAERTRNFKDCNENLTVHHCSLQACLESLEAWKRLWYHKMRNDDDYIHFWGQQGYEQVRQFAEIIQKLSLKVQALLPNQTILTDVNITRKLAFALVQDGDLKARISNLKDSVNAMGLYSRERFLKLHEPEPKDEELDELLQLKHETTLFSAWMDRLHKEQCLRDDSWSLLLRIPSDKDGIILDEAGLSVEFLVEQQAENCIAKVSYNRGVAEPRTSPILPQTTSFYPKCLDVSKQPFLASAISPSMRKSLERERSHAAHGLAAWTFPLLRTAWTTNFCSCIIHLASEEDTKISVLDSGRQLSCRIHQRIDQLNPEEHMQGRAFLLLGITLAELILAESLQVTTNINEGKQLELSFHTQDRTLEEVKLLRDINQKSPGYMKAVDYCFQLYRDMTVDGFSACDDKRFRRKVLTP
jgi:hypothetical protein